jgi:hypothetical protein
VTERKAIVRRPYSLGTENRRCDAHDAGPECLAPASLVCSIGRLGGHAVTLRTCPCKMVNRELEGRR